MTPVDTARRLTLLRGGDWQQELEAFMSSGFVISTPDVFAMGRMCAKSDHLPDPWEPWPIGPDFFAWAIVGKLHALARHLPMRPDHIGWFRQGRGWGRNHWVSYKSFESALAMKSRL